MTPKEIDEASYKLADRAPHVRIVHHVVSDTESEQDTRVLVARSIPHPDVPGRLIDVNPVTRLFALDAFGKGRIHRDQTAGE